MAPTSGPREFRTFRVTALVLYLGALLVATLGPVSGMAPTFLGADKLVHFVLFAGLVPLIYFNVSTSPAWRVAISVVLAAALAALVELVQIPLPHRRGDHWDLAAGSLGAVLAGALTPTLVNRLRRRWEQSVT